MPFGLGELLSLGAALTWAVGVVLYRQLGATLAPVTLNGLNNGLVLLAVSALLPLVPGALPQQVAPGQALLTLASGVLGIALADTLYFRALNALGAGRMGILGGAYSPFVLLLGMGLLGERLDAWQWAGFVLVGLGVLTIALPAGRAGVGRQPTPPADAPTGAAHAAPCARRPARTGTLRAVLAGVASVALMAAAIVMIKPGLETQPLLWTMWLRLLGGVGGLWLLLALRGQAGRLRPPPGAVPWGRLAAAALFGQGLAMLLWLAGNAHTQATVAAVLNESSSVFVLLLAVLWLREPLTRRALAGIALSFAGVACMLARSG